VLVSTASIPMAQVQYAGSALEGKNVDEFTYQNCVEGSRCDVSFRLKDDMEGPIYVLFSVDPFHMNMNHYMKSGSISQVKGNFGTEQQAKAACTSALEENGQRLWPCGLKAASLFNDTYELRREKNSANVAIQETGIAWDSDLNFLKNPEEYDKQANVRWLHDRFPDITNLRKDGVRNEHFAVWNRPAALPNTLKLWGIIQENLAAGEALRLTVGSNFPVSEFDGRKSFMLIKKGVLGGRSDSLGVALIVVGAMGMVFGIVVLISHVIGCTKISKVEQQPYTSLEVPGTGSGSGDTTASVPPNVIGNPAPPSADSVVVENY